MDLPLTFRPLYMERVWGGRTLETRFGRTLPTPGPYGESWEIVDRPEAQSVVAEGPLAGTTLHDLWREHRVPVFGEVAAQLPYSRFPLLVKILDARERLSLQVHPPAHVAPSLNGEPKTEMWYIAHAEPGAELYVGVKPGVTREAFAQALATGTAETLVHRLSVQTGDSIFIPSGRLHAIGAGLLIYEIQQNSDTTYRVFDWNRLGLDGKPRPLHIEESLACIDFTDTSPTLNPPERPLLAECEHFRVTRLKLEAGKTYSPANFTLVAVVEGTVTTNNQTFGPGSFLLFPAAAGGASGLTAETDALLLVTTWP